MASSCLRLLAAAMLFYVNVLEVHGIQPSAPEGTVILVTDWGSPARILNVSLTHMNFSTVPIDDVARPVAIDYDVSNDKIYWTDVLLEQIRETDIRTGTDTVLVQLNNSSTPDGIAVDGQEKFLFYTDAGNNIITKMNLDDMKSEVIVQEDLHEPRGIILHQEKRILYWTDWGLTPKIESSEYDGQNRRTLVSTGLEWPNGITLDKHEERLYWCDAKRSVIETMLLDGTDRRLILQEPGAHYFDIFHYQDILYFTDWKRPKSLLHVSSSGGVVGNMISAGFNQLTGLHVIPSSETVSKFPARVTTSTTKTVFSSPDTRTKLTSMLPQETASSYAMEDDETTVDPYMDFTGTMPSGEAAIERKERDRNELSFGMKMALALGCVSVVLLLAIVLLVAFYRNRRSKERELERYRDLVWTRQQSFTNNTYTLMEGDTPQETSQDYLVPCAETKPTDDIDHFYEDIDELKKELSCT